MLLASRPQLLFLSQSLSTVWKFNWLFFLLLMFRAENSYPYPKGFFFSHSLMVRLGYLLRSKKIQHHKRSYELLPRHRHAHFPQPRSEVRPIRISLISSGAIRENLCTLIWRKVNYILVHTHWWIKGGLCLRAFQSFANCLKNSLRPTEN